MMSGKDRLVFLIFGVWILFLIFPFLMGGCDVGESAEKPVEETRREVK
jgi:hypothetical protein